MNSLLQETTQFRQDRATNAGVDEEEDGDGHPDRAERALTPVRLHTGK
jgi:hypothetical protein